MAENVKVAVRVRPFNSRENTRGAKLIIHMSGTQTAIMDPAIMDKGGEPKKFSFDYSYWSHDGFQERENGYLEPTTAKYADQKKVFDDLGRGVLENAWKGYNCSLFAYGQTGSGKSYSMVGYGANKGIVPITCEELFKGIEAKKGTEAEYQVVLNMLEIYNEQVRDLLNPASNVKGGLKVREHPSRGFYVDQLRSVAVKNYKDIEDRIAEGTKNRTIASTNMNATSSRAHTIVAITFVQKTKNEFGQNMSKTSVINLVDLAGSERADSTGATGARLQEGAAINKSLSTLGNVIKALADISSGKKALVPFRDSVLTKLLKNALGGNSKTIMIAALSPADINYDETLSTLRFADRAKSIKTQATVNESPTDKLIRELREENAKLLDMIKKGNYQITDAPSGTSEEEAAQLKKEMEEGLARTLEANKQEMEELQKTWEQRLAESQQANMGRDKAKEEEQKRRKTTPHFWNLNEDPQLTDMVVHFVKKGKSRIGNKKATPLPEILINGLSVQKEHALLENSNNDTITISPCPGAKVLINGEPLAGKVTLHHNDRVLIGSSNLYIFHHPKELTAMQKAGKKPQTITYDFAQGEIATSSGFDMSTEGKSKEDILLQEDLIALMPMVYEANAISEELNKKMAFEIVLLPPQARGLKDGRTEVKVKMRNLDNGYSWMWSRNQFLERKYRMQEMYQNYVEGEQWDLPQKDDPFWEPTDVDVQIGSVHVYLQSLTYMIELEEQLAITDYKGNEQGHLSMEVLPCKPDGSMLSEDEDLFVEEPEELLGTHVNFLLKIKHARGIPSRFTKGVYCKYRFYLDNEDTKTASVSNTSNPNFDFSKHFSMNPVTQQFLEYLTLQPLIIEVWGQQVEVHNANKPAATHLMTTKELMNKETAKFGSVVILNPDAQKDEQRYRLMCELSAAKRRADRLEVKIRKIKELVDKASKQGSTTLEIQAVKEILNAEIPNFKAVATVVQLANRASKAPAATTSSTATGEGGTPNSQACSVM